MIHLIVKRYELLVDLIADMFGSQCEVVLHDVHKDVEHSIVKIRNGHVTGRSIGGPLTDLGLKQIMDNGPDTVLFTETTDEGKIIRCSGIVIRDEKRKIVGFLCIILNLSDTFFTELEVSSREYKNVKEDRNHFEHYPKDTEQLLHEVVVEYFGKMEKDCDNLTKNEKLDFIKYLNDHGIFMIKGMIIKVSKRLGTTKQTIYNYLSRIEGFN